MVVSSLGCAHRSSGSIGAVPRIFQHFQAQMHSRPDVIRLPKHLRHSANGKQNESMPVRREMKSKASLGSLTSIRCLRAALAGRSLKRRPKPKKKGSHCREHRGTDGDVVI